VPSNVTLPDAVSPDIHPQVQPDTESELNHPDIVPDIDSEFPVESETTNVPSKTTTRSGRQVRPPKHLRDFVLLSNLSERTHFAPSRNLPRVRCEVFNHQKLSNLQWDALLTSLRGGSFGSLLSYTSTKLRWRFLPPNGTPVSLPRKPMQRIIQVGTKLRMDPIPKASRKLAKQNTTPSSSKRLLGCR
jgi:hypothetical protein